jgi:hypothetical protein
MTSISTGSSRDAEPLVATSNFSVRVTATGQSIPHPPVCSIENEQNISRRIPAAGLALIF